MSIPVFKAMIAAGCGCWGAVFLIVGDAYPDGASIASVVNCGAIGFVGMAAGSWVITSIVLGIAGHQQFVADTADLPRVGYARENASAVTLQFLADRRRNGGPIEELAERVGGRRGPK